MVTAEVKSFRVFEMLVGDDDKERMGLAKRRLTRRLAPQVHQQHDGKKFITTEQGSFFII